jgi:hypothetical protein
VVHQLKRNVDQSKTMLGRRRHDADAIKRQRLRTQGRAVSDKRIQNEFLTLFRDHCHLHEMMAGLHAGSREEFTRRRDPQTTRRGQAASDAQRNGDKI